MKKILFPMIIAISIFASCNSNNKITNAKPLLVATSDSTEKYQCPMKCQSDTAYTSAGKCPICEMDLKKLK